VTLKSGITEDIVEMFGRLQREAEIIVDDVVELTYFMRGAISYEEMMRRTYGERQRVAHFIEKHLKQEAKKPYPQY